MMDVRLHIDRITTTDVDPFIESPNRPFVWVKVKDGDEGLHICVTPDGVHQARALAAALRAAADSVVLEEQRRQAHKNALAAEEDSRARALEKAS